ncbi:DUF5522 domain-containing protein [Aureibacter tunicatorum]|uniref:Cysteine-rich CWC n=1 Tax=Aureibacter tunicatorum TaxID=866807 RepID=A0AAE3XRJ4_9BACT|nr:DUF5522 domain-containing protein [Aureibacter tunicatorum]MDR6240743.1 hypothetical protein [Aureibacter tunicatorum]
MSEKQCPSCGSSFGCQTCGSSSCWCADYPSILPCDPNAKCLCPVCMKTRIIERANELTLKAKESIENHALIPPLTEGYRPIEGLDYNIDNVGRFVFTSWYLLRRKFCCGNGCKACPYP